MIVNYFLEDRFMCDRFDDRLAPDDRRAIHRQGMYERARLALWRGVRNAIAIMLTVAMVAGLAYWLLRLVPVMMLWNQFIQLNGGSHGVTTWA